MKFHCAIDFRICYMVSSTRKRRPNSSVHQKLSLASDIVSEAMRVHIGHLSSYIGHFTYQMINNVTGHRTCPTCPTVFGLHWNSGTAPTVV